MNNKSNRKIGVITTQSLCTIDEGAVKIIKGCFFSDLQITADYITISDRITRVCRFRMIDWINVAFQAFPIHNSYGRFVFSFDFRRR